jgi:hypothetical protein
MQWRRLPVADSHYVSETAQTCAQSIVLPCTLQSPAIFSLFGAAKPIRLLIAGKANDTNNLC